MPKQRFTDTNYQEWVKLYETDKISCDKIAKLYDCSQWNVKHHLKRLGVQIRTCEEAWNLLSGFSNQIGEEWIRLYTIEMWSTIRIAKLYEMDPVTVTYHLKKLGVKIRSIKEAQNLPYPKKRLSETHKGLLIGVKHPNWKGGYNRGYRDNSTHCRKHIAWRKKVYRRDNYTCQHCKIRGIKLQAHHIFIWSKFEDLRYDINNGITLCLDCHWEVHKIFKTNIADYYDIFGYFKLTKCKEDQMKCEIRKIDTITVTGGTENGI